MPKIRIDKDRCKGCELCILHCPRQLIKRDESLNIRGVYPAVFSPSDKGCTGCSFCALICPDLCIEVYR